MNFQDYQSLFEHSGIVIIKWSGTKGGLIEQVTPNVEDLFGYTMDDFHATSYYDIVFKEDLIKIQEEVKSALENKLNRFTHSPYRIFTQNQEIRWVHDSTVIVYNKKQKITHFLSSVQDITEEQQTKAKLLDIESRYALAIEATQDGLWDWNPITDEVFYSQKWKEMLGYQEHEIGNALSEWRDRVHPEDINDVMADVNAHLQGKTPYYNNKHRVRCKDGRYKWILDRGKAMFTSEGKPYRVIGFHTDITEKKQAEIQYRTVVNNLKEVIFQTDVKGLWTFLNPAWKTITGFNIKESLGTLFLHYIHPEDYQHNIEIFKSLIQKQKKYYNYEIRYLHKNGGFRWFEVYVSCIVDEQDNIVGTSGTLNDITKRKNIEKTLKLQLTFQKTAATVSARFLNASTQDFDHAVNQSLQQLGQLFDSDRSYLFRFSDDLSNLSNTHEWCAKGIAPQMHRIQNFSSINLPYFFKEILKLKPIHIPDVNALPVEAQIEKQEFQAQYIQSLLCIPLIGKQKKLLGFIGFDAVKSKYIWSEQQIMMLQILADIWAAAIERIQTEITIQQQKEKLHFLLNNINAIGWELALDTNTFTYVSSNVERLLGYPANKWTDMNFWASIVVAEDRDYAVDYCAVKTLNGQDHSFEYRMRKANGEIIWVLDIVSVVKENNIPVKLVGFILDNSQQHELIDQLKISENRYKEAQRLAHVGSWEHDIQNNILSWSDEIYRMLALEPQSFKPSYDLLITYMHPEDKEYAIKAYTQAIEEKRNYQIIHRFITKDNKTVYVDIKGEVFLNKQGEVSHFIGTAHNITKIKEQQQALEESQALYQSLVNSLPLNIYRIDLDRKVIFANPYLLNNSKLKLEEVIGKISYNFYPKALAEKYCQDDEKVIKQKQTLHLTQENINPNTKKNQYFEVLKIPIINNQGEVEGVQGVYWDVTERKEAEIQLQHSEKRYHELVSNMLDGLVVYEAIEQGQNFIVTEFNYAAEKITKTPRVKVIGQIVTKVFPGIIAMGVFKIIQEVWKTGIPQFYPETQYIDSRITFWAENYIYKLPSGEVVVTFNDVTQQKKIEAKIFEKERDLRIILENAPQGMVIVNKHYQVIEYNRKAYELFGLSANSYYEARYFPEILKEWAEYTEQSPTMLAQAIKDLECADHFEIEFPQKIHNQLRWCHLTHTPLSEGGFVRTFMDITERKQIEQKLIESEALHRALNESLPVGVVMHDAKTKAIIAANPSASIILDLSQDQLLGRMSYDSTWYAIKENGSVFLGEEHPAMVTLATGVPQRNVIMGLKYNHKIKWISINSQALYKSEEKRPYAVIVAFIDISERKIVEEKLKETNEQLEKIVEERTKVLKEQSEEYRLLLDSLPLMVIYKDTKNNILNVNKPVADSLFTTVDAMRNRPTAKFFPKDAKQYYQDDLEVIQNKKAKLNIEERYITPEGEKWIETSKLPLFDDKGEVKSLIVVIRDITEFRKQQEKYYTLFNSSNDAFFIYFIDEKTGMPSKFIEINDKSCELLGYNREKILQLTPLDIENPKEPKEIPEIIKMLLKKNKFMFEDNFLTQSGKKIPIELNMQLIELDGKKAVFASARDISSRKALEEKSRQQEQMLLQQSRFAAIGEMIGAIAHQWRQPLTTLGGVFINIIDDFEFGEMSLESLREQIQNGEELISYMSQTIDDFRNFFDPHKEKQYFDLQYQLKEALRLLEAQLKHHQITYKIYCLENNKLVDSKVVNYNCYGYPNEIKQVIINLVSNAKDAIISNKKEGNILIHLDKKENTIILEIADNGGGIPLEIIEKIFYPYFTTKHQSQGTGLGLYVAKTIVEKNMKGSLMVHNQEEGACFTITLPLIEDNNKIRSYTEE